MKTKARGNLIELVVVSLAHAQKGLAILERASNHRFVPVMLVKPSGWDARRAGLQLAREIGKTGETAEGSHENILLGSMLHGRGNLLWKLEVDFIVDIPTAPMTLMLQFDHQETIFVVLWLRKAFSKRL